MPSPPAATCPSCRAAMAVHAFDSVRGGTVQLECDRLTAQREAQTQRGSLFSREVPDADLWELGVTMVWKIPH